MGELLLISDDLPRAERLARDLAPLGPCRILDLYDEAVTACPPELVVSDVAALTSEAVLRLRRILGRTRRDGVPYLFIAHGNAARAEAQARILGASDTLGTGAVANLLLKKLAGMGSQLKPDRAAVRTLAGEGRLFLREVFFSGASVTPDLIENGTTLVTKAIGACGVRDWVEEVRRFNDATHQHCLLVAGLAAAFGTSLCLRAPVTSSARCAVGGRVMFVSTSSTRTARDLGPRPDRRDRSRPRFTPQLGSAVRFGPALQCRR